MIEDAQYSPILRFTLEDPKERTFKVERWSFLGRIDDWIDIWQFGKLDELADRLIPLLGTDDFLISMIQDMKKTCLRIGYFTPINTQIRKSAGCSF